MSSADRLAVRLKVQHELLRNAARVRIGLSEYAEIASNPEPCDPPDFTQGDSTIGLPDMFCGVPVERSDKPREFSVVINIP